MCRILFIIHLVPLVLVELFVRRKYSKNRLKWWQTWTKEASGRGRATWVHLGPLPGPTRAPPSPPSCHATSPIHGSRANPKLPFKVVWSMDKICSWWIHGPTVIDLGASTDLPATIPSKFHHVLASQPTWRSNHSATMQWRWILGPAGVPLVSPNTLVPPSTLPLPTNTPSLTIHYK
jgi:hypothetical protein